MSFVLFGIPYIIGWVICALSPLHGFEYTIRAPRRCMASPATMWKNTIRILKILLGKYSLFLFPLIPSLHIVLVCGRQSRFPHSRCGNHLCSSLVKTTQRVCRPRCIFRPHVADLPAHGGFLCRRSNSPWTCWAPTPSSPTCPSSWQSSSPAQRAPARQAAAARAAGRPWRGGSTVRVCLTRLWANCHGSEILILFLFQGAVCCTVQFCLFIFWAHDFSYADLKWDFVFFFTLRWVNEGKLTPPKENTHAASLWWHPIVCIPQLIKACKLRHLLSDVSPAALTSCYLRLGKKKRVNFQVNCPSKDSLFFSFAPIIVALPHLHLFCANPPVGVFFSSTAATST